MLSTSWSYGATIRKTALYSLVQPPPSSCNAKNYLKQFSEPDFDYIEALSPYQPLQMKIAHCAIDTSLNFKQANKLIQELKPATLVVPECYTQPPPLAPTLTDLVIENSSDRTLISYKWGEVYLHN